MKNILQRITRKTLLYKTEVEYGDWTINHVQGCAHGCLYPCYAFLMAKRFGKVQDYQEWIQPCLVSNALELLDSEIPKYQDKIKFVHLCFSTDPFMYGYQEITDMSMKIIKKLNENNIKCTVLTKGILPFELSGFNKNNEYGITLISLNEQFRKKIEPFASSYTDRIESLYNLHNKGCKTWVSVEPYPTPNIIEQNFDALLSEISFVDKIIFGRMNYNKKVKEYEDYRDYFNGLSRKVNKFCEENGIAWHIKKGTITKRELA